MTTDVTIKIDMPGAFDSWFGLSSVAQGQVDGSGYDGAADLYRAYLSARKIKRGHGYSLRLTLPDRDAIDCLLDYAQTCVAINSVEPDHAELSAARRVVERCEAALAKLSSAG